MKKKIGFSKNWLQNNHQSKPKHLHLTLCLYTSSLILMSEHCVDIIPDLNMYNSFNQLNDIMKTCCYIQLVTSDKDVI